MPFYCTIVRHGETVGNVAGLMQCSSGGELTSRGRKMSRAMGRWISDERFSTVYSSDLSRSVETTKIMLEELKSKPNRIIYTPLLRERDYGEWENKPVGYPPIQEKIAEMKLEPRTYHRIQGPPNGETYEQAKDRAAKFFNDEILRSVDETSDQDQNNVLVVFHGILLMCLLDYIIENPEIFQLVNFNPDQLSAEPSNCCRTRFAITEPQAGGPAGGKPLRQLHFTHFFDTEHLRNYQN